MRRSLRFTPVCSARIRTSSSCHTPLRILRSTPRHGTWYMGKYPRVPGQDAFRFCISQRTRRPPSSCTESIRTTDSLLRSSLNSICTSHCDPGGHGNTFRTVDSRTDECTFRGHSPARPGMGRCLFSFSLSTVVL